MMQPRLFPALIAENLSTSKLNRLISDRRQKEDQLSVLFFCVAYFLVFCPYKQGDMRRQKTFDRVLALIEEETEIAREFILSGNKQEEVVDARALLIITLYDMGFYPSQIATMTGICSRCINPFIINFHERKRSRKILGIYYETVKKKVREWEEESTL